MSLRVPSLLALAVLGGCLPYKRAEPRADPPNAEAARRAFAWESAPERRRLSPSYILPEVAVCAQEGLVSFQQPEIDSERICGLVRSGQGMVPVPGHPSTSVPHRARRCLAFKNVRYVLAREERRRWASIDPLQSPPDAPMLPCPPS